MPIQVNWYNAEKTILLMEFISPWTWEDVYQMTDDSIKMLNTVYHTVDVIHDWTRSHKVPPNALSHARNLIRKRHANAGITVAFGTNSNPAITSLWDIFLRLSGSLGIEPRYQVVRTREEALRKLTEIQSHRMIHKV